MTKKPHFTGIFFADECTCVQRSNAIDPAFPLMIAPHTCARQQPRDVLLRRVHVG
jgi:hypothetical protein